MGRRAEIRLKRTEVENQTKIVNEILIFRMRKTVECKILLRVAVYIGVHSRIVECDKEVSIL